MSLLVLDSISSFIHDSVAGGKYHTIPLVPTKVWIMMITSSTRLVAKYLGYRPQKNSFKSIEQAKEIKSKKTKGKVIRK